MNAKKSFMIIAGLALAASCGCKATLPARKAPAEGKLPTAYSTTGKTEKVDRWWTVFGSDELNRLVDEALAENLTIEQAWQRLRQAEAVAAKSGASRLPSLNGTGSATRNRSAENKSTSTGRQRTIATAKEYTLGLAASYELDLWGRIRDSHMASRLSAQASRQDVESAAMSIAASVVDIWVQISEKRAVKKLLLSQIKNNRDQLDLIELRQRKSLSSALDVYQQKQIVAQTEAQLPLIEAEEQLLLHRLAVLMGKMPREEINCKVDSLPPMPELPGAGLPAELLANRPDLRAARMRLESADWNVAAAKADRLPAIRLSATGAYNTDSGGEIDTVFENWFLNLASSLTAPIFDGGSKKATVVAARASADELLAAYRQLVLTAVKEVEDSLLSEAKQKEYLEAKTRQAEYSKASYEEARERYFRAINDYLPVLQALESQQGLERNLIQIRRQLISYRIALYRALGGGWTEKINPMAIIDVDEREQ